VHIKKNQLVQLLMSATYTKSLEIYTSVMRSITNTFSQSDVRLYLSHEQTLKILNGFRPIAPPECLALGKIEQERSVAARITPERKCW
jgi:hypothetical protein